jgi:predicted CxxxxCH...CXXCH cytochrome family protein
VLCHNRTVTADRKLLPGGLHENGRVDVGDGSGTCYACHGTAASLAPPTDLQGNTAITAIGVGVHQSHLKATSKLRGPIPCSDCHLVPARVDDPSHIGTTLMAAVFPRSAGFISLAQADGAQPQWDHTTATCSNVYCHGGGAKLATDLTPKLVRTPLWTQLGQAACGTCHGIPPLDPNHTPAMRLVDCAGCHPATMDATGTLRVSGVPGAETSAHINGVVDVR